MANIVEKVANDFNFPNITIYRVYVDGFVSSYRARPNAGYVMYDPAANDTILDPNTMQEIPIIYYPPVAGFPKTYDFAKFPYTAVLKALINT